MEKVSAVIFDLDGTLGNTIPLCLEAFREAIEPLIGRTITDREIIDTFGPSEGGTIQQLIPNHYNKGLTDYLLLYKKLHYKYPEPFKGINQLLNELKNRNIRIGMVTGKGKHSTKITLDKFGISNYFEIIETGKTSGPSKPEGLKKVITHFKNINKNEIIYVGDAPSDITACNEVGIPIIAAAWSETAEPDKLLMLNPNKLFTKTSDFTTWVLSKT